jgi:hypothetical protein
MLIIWWLLGAAVVEAVNPQMALVVVAVAVAVVVF